MKKIISLILCAIFALSAVSCAIPQSPAKSATSSDHSKYTTYAADYLGKYHGVTAKADGNTLTVGNKTVVLTDSSAEYCIDASTVPSGAYAIRMIGNDGVIVASDGSGFDRGVRRLVHDYADENGLLDGDIAVTDGIGYRVGSISVAGRDIGDFAIYTADDGDKPKAYAAEELQKYIAKTTGDILPITNTKPADKYIELRIDPTATDASAADGYRIVVENGNLVIEGGIRCGCLNGVYTLLEKYLGWRFLTNEIEYLYEAESIDIPSDTDFTDLPAMPYRDMYEGTFTSTDFQAKMKCTVKGSRKYGGAVIERACHGVIDWMHKAELWTSDEEQLSQPCFMDDGTFEAVIEVICKDIDKKVAAGKEYGIGKDFCMIDVAHADNSNFCDCKKCRDWRKGHGYVTSATTLYFANRVAEVMQENYPGIYVSTFGYGGTEIPPTNMTALDNVVVSYCFYIPCSNHSINGKDCQSTAHWNNTKMGEQFTEWSKICKHMNGWYYPWQNYGDITTFNVYDDFRFMTELGGDGFFGLMPAKNDLTFSYLICYVCGRMAWSADTMTKEEFIDLIREFFTLCYGDASEELYEILRIWNEAGDRMPCWTGGWNKAFDMNNMEYFGSQYDHLCELFDYVISRSNCERTEEYMKTLYCSVHYLGICAVHDERYINGTPEERAVIEERYSYMYNRYKEKNIVPESEGFLYTIPDELDFNVNPRTWSWD